MGKKMNARKLTEGERRSGRKETAREEEPGMEGVG